MTKKNENLYSVINFWTDYITPGFSNYIQYNNVTIWPFGAYIWQPVNYYLPIGCGGGTPIDELQQAWSRDDEGKSTELVGSVNFSE